VSLDDFQARMLTALPEGDVEAVRRAAPDPATRAWVDSWDPDLAALAGVLVLTWSRRGVAAP
jgi:hypothetical protein